MNTGVDDEYRLQLLNEVYNPFSRDFIQKTPLPQDANILEIGCGAGHQSIWMANQITPNGRVIAADSSEKQIAIAKKNAQLAEINNIEFENIDIENLDTNKFQVDLATNRFLLLHLKNPKLAIEAMAKLLKPNAYLICEDVIMSGVIAGPSSETLNHAFYLFSEHLRKQNKNPDMGAELFSLYNSLGFQDIEVNVVQPILRTVEQKNLMHLSFSAVKQSLLEQGLLDQSEFDRINNTLIKEVHNQNQLYFAGRLVQIRGRMPKF